MERCSQPLKSATHGGLAEQQALRRPRDISLLGQGSEYHKKVEIGLT
jgi:hypothetical protein